MSVYASVALLRNKENFTTRDDAHGETGLEEEVGVTKAHFASLFPCPIEKVINALKASQEELR